MARPLLLKTPGDATFVRTGAPLYRDVATALERAVREGVWKPGDQIPTEPDLEARYGASRGTLRMAVSELVRKGLLYRQAGRGTFVIGPSFQGMDRYFRYENRAGDPTILPHHTLLEKKMRRATAVVARALAIEPGTQVAFIRRLRSYRSEPFLIVDSWFPIDVWQPLSQADFGAIRLYDVLRDECGVYVVRVDEYLRAGLADATEAALLETEPRSAVIRFERIAYTFENRPIEYRQAVGHGDRFHYHVRIE